MIMTKPTRQISFIWLLAKHVLGWLLLTSLLICQLIKPWHVSIDHHCSSLYNYAIQTTIVNDYYWSKEAQRKRTLIASHHHHHHFLICLENSMGVLSLSHTSWLYLQNVVKRWICTKRSREREWISLFYLELTKNLSDIFLLLLLSSSCSYSHRASYYVNE